MQSYSVLSNYSKVPSPDSVPVDVVEAWLDVRPHLRAENKPNGGIISATKSVTFTDMPRGKSSPDEIAAAKRAAKKLYAAANARLRNGKAQHRIVDNRRKSGAGRPKLDMELSTRRGQAVLDQLRRDGYYNSSDWDKSRTYFIKIMAEIKEIEKIEAVKGAEGFIISYRLVK